MNSELNRLLLASYLLLVSLLCSAQGQGEWLCDLKARVDSVIGNARMLRTSQMGLLIYDLTADSVVYARDEAQTLRPASTMKLLTAITALDRLGAGYRYATRLAYRGDISTTITYDEEEARADTTGVLRGDVIIKGSMDPMIAEEDLMRFANSIKALGIDTIRGSLCADRTMKDGDMYGEGWCWDDDNAMLSPLVYKRKDDMMERFREALATAGVYHDGTLTVGACPDDAVTAYVVTHSLYDILMPMMKQSNNLYAESVFYHIGLTKGTPSTAKKARAVVEEVMQKAIDPVASMPVHRIADGSGLSLYNYVSAEIEVAFLRYAYANKNIYGMLYESLPVAAVDGTLKDRMAGTPAAGNVHAKTGTLSGVSSLAGYCTASNGHLLAFSIMNQGVMKGVYAKALQNRICEAMCGGEKEATASDGQDEAALAGQ